MAKAIAKIWAEIMARIYLLQIWPKCFAEKIGTKANSRKMATVFKKKFASPNFVRKLYRAFFKIFPDSQFSRFFGAGFN